MEGALVSVLMFGGAIVSAAVLAGGFISDFKSEPEKEVEDIASRCP